MRIKNFLRNSAFSVGAYALTFLLSLLVRKGFVTFLSLEYLGYEGLFSNVFALLSLAELGVGGVISFSLYKELADQNWEEIGKLMTIFKYLYMGVGVLVAVIGGVLFFFLDALVTEDVTDWGYVRLIFLVQLGTALCTYFLAYKRTLFLADQKEYVCVKIDAVIQIISQSLRLFFIVVFHSYTLYLLTALAATVGGNLLISRKAKKVYPQAMKKAKVTKEDIKKRNFISEMLNISVTSIAGVIYGSTDNIVIAALLGISQVALFSNYMLVLGGVNAAITKLLAPLQAGIGNLVYSKDTEKGSALFFGANMGMFFLAVFVSTCFLVLFQPFVTLWLGQRFLLPLSFVAALCINAYVGNAGLIICYFRTAFGSYNQDRTAMILSAVTNLGLSILLAPYLGLTGIIIGTIIGHLFFQFARLRFVFKNYLKMPYGGYLARQLALFALAVGEGALTYALASGLPVSVLGVAARLGLCLLIPNLINLLIFYRTKDFATIRFYLRQSVQILLDWVRRKRGGSV